MRRVAALYDIHGNLPALEAVLGDVRRAGVDEIVIGGDVLPGPMPRETLECVLGLDVPTRFIRGNGDRLVASQMRGIDTPEVPEPYRAPIRFGATELREHHLRALESWPETVRVDVDGLGAVLFCHATPRNDTEMFTSRTPVEVLAPVFDGLGVATVVCGHTHMQFDRMVGSTRVVNAGSVGMPFGEPGAYWLLLGPGVELRHTAYDLDLAAERIRATPYPDAERFASGHVLQPPTAASMLDAFARAELR